MAVFACGGEGGTAGRGADETAAVAGAFAAASFTPAVAADSLGAGAGFTPVEFLRSESLELPNFGLLSCALLTTLTGSAAGFSGLISDFFTFSGGAAELAPFLGAGAALIWDAPPLREESAAVETLAAGRFDFASAAELRALARGVRAAPLDSTAFDTFFVTFLRAAIGQSPETRDVRALPAT